MFLRKTESEAGENQAPEKLRYSTYYEQDGALRAYANRAMLLAFISAPTALLAVGLAIYVRIQPPTIVRVNADGNATMLSQPQRGVNTLTISQGASAAPSDLEKRALVRTFLDRYQNFTPETVAGQWASAVNLMSSNLRRATLAEMQKQNAVGKIQDEQITSIFHLRSIEPEKDDPFTFLAFGVKEVHRIQNHQDANDKLVTGYRIQLVPEKRSEENPSGLLVAGYSEQLIEGEKRNAILDDSATKTN